MLLMKFDKRNSKAIKNVLFSFFLKGGSILTSLLIVPMTLSYLNSYEYGVWLTLSSILSWIYILDIGLGNGLRNKLTEALAIKNMHLAKVYVSTTFSFMTVLVVVFYILYLFIHQWLDWYSILNVGSNSLTDLSSIVLIVLAFFSIGFLFRIIGNIYMAYQLSAVNDLLSFLGNLFALVILYFCTQFSSGSLKNVAIIFSATPVLVYVLAYPITFWRYKEIAPAWGCIKMKYLKSLMSLGVKFFIVQISCLVLFMTSNFIISHLFGPQEVTPYNIAFKYFSVLSMGFTIVVTPFWSAITEAYTLKDMVWIQKNVRNLILVWLVFVLCAVIMVFMAPFVYDIWIGGEVKIPVSLSVFCAVYACISNWNNIFSFMINGTGKLHLQLISSIVQGILFLPLALFLGKTMGVIGVIIASCLCLFLSSIWSPIQCWKIVNNKAKGIWNR